MGGWRNGWGGVALGGGGGRCGAKRVYRGFWGEKVWLEEKLGHGAWDYYEETLRSWWYGLTYHERVRILEGIA